MQISWGDQVWGTNRKENKETWIESQKSVEHNEAYQHIYSISLRKRGKREKAELLRK